MAFNRPTAGPRCCVDGRDLLSLRLGDYRQHLGVVLQDNFLFDGTVAENIAYGTPHATRADIERVSRIAHADEFIEAFEKDYDTVVGERGVRLSGGQRQRVAIARAILAESARAAARRSDVEPRQRERGDDSGRPAVAPSRPHDVRDRAPAVDDSQRRSDPRPRGRRDRRARHARASCSRTGGRYRQLYDKQYNFERDRFINPGEDFTPEPPKAAPVPVVPSRM